MVKGHASIYEVDKTMFASVTMSNSKYYLIRASKVQDQSESCIIVFVRCIAMSYWDKIRFFMVLFMYIIDSH